MAAPTPVLTGLPVPAPELPSPARPTPTLTGIPQELRDKIWQLVGNVIEVKFTMTPSYQRARPRTFTQASRPAQVRWQYHCSQRQGNASLQLTFTQASRAQYLAGRTSFLRLNQGPKIPFQQGVDVVYFDLESWYNLYYYVTEHRGTRTRRQGNALRVAPGNLVGFNQIQLLGSPKRPSVAGQPQQIEYDIALQRFRLAGLFTQITSIRQLGPRGLIIGSTDPTIPLHLQTVDMRIDRATRLKLDDLARERSLTPQQLQVVNNAYTHWRTCKNFSMLLLPGMTPGSNLDNGDLLLLGITVT
jgi:hypothetical protein